MTTEQVKQFVPINLFKAEVSPLVIAYCYREDGLQVVTGGYVEILRHFQYDAPFHAMIHIYARGKVRRKSWTLLGKTMISHDHEVFRELILSNCETGYVPTELRSKLKDHTKWILYYSDNSSGRNVYFVFRTWRKLPSCYLDVLKAW
jgi:hypothetical protein